MDENSLEYKIHDLLVGYYHLYLRREITNDLAKFVEMMLEYNEKHNLTAITKVDEVLLKHLLDSLLPLPLLKDTDKIIDIGCGAGFPSIPLAIVNRNLQITALDSVQKKTNFVEMVKKELKLDNLRVVNARIEDFARDPNERQTYDVAVSRAVAPLNIITEYSAPMLKNGGYIMAYKGMAYLEELQMAERAFRLLDCKLKDVTGFYIYELETNRYVLRITKNSNIIDKYPRKQNKPRIKPL